MHYFIEPNPTSISPIEVDRDWQGENHERKGK